MLAETETTVAEILKLLGRIDVVTTAQRNAKRDLTSSTMKRKVREGDLEGAKEKLTELEYVPDLRIRLSTLEDAVLLMEGLMNHKLDQIEQIKRLTEIYPHRIPKTPLVPSMKKFQIKELLVRLEQIKPCKIPLAIDLPPYDIVKPGLIKWLDELMKLEFGLEKLVTEVYFLDEEIEEQIALRKIVEETLGACPVCDRPFEESHEH